MLPDTQPQTARDTDVTDADLRNTLDEQQADRARAEAEAPRARIGDPILYRVEAADVQKYKSPHVLPGIVTRVNDDGTVNATIFNDGPHNEFKKNLRFGNFEGQFTFKDDEDDETGADVLQRGRTGAGTVLNEFRRDPANVGARPETT